MKTNKYQWFLQWEAASRDSINVKRVYIDVAGGDLVAGVLLSQIVYWHLPGRDKKPRIRVYKEGKHWLAKRREDWWEECRITPKRFDRACKLLESLGIIETKVFKFDGSPTKHIHLKLDVLVPKIEEWMKGRGEFSSSQKGKNDLDQTGRSLTENTNIHYDNIESSVFPSDSPPSSASQNSPEIPRPNLESSHNSPTHHPPADSGEKNREEPSKGLEILSLEDGLSPKGKARRREQLILELLDEFEGLGIKARVRQYARIIARLEKEFGGTETVLDFIRWCIWNWLHLQEDEEAGWKLAKEEPRLTRILSTPFLEHFVPKWKKARGAPLGKKGAFTNTLAQKYGLRVASMDVRRKKDGD